MAGDAQATRRRWPIPGSVRLRTAVLATLSVCVGIGIAALAAIWLQRETLTDNIDSGLALRADDVASLVASGILPPTLNVTDPEVSAVQVVNSAGEVISTTSNLAGRPPMSSARPAPGMTTIETLDELSLDDEKFRLLARTLSTAGGPLTVYVAGNLDAVHESVDSLTRLALLGFPILAAFVAFSSWLVVGRALGPVEGIRREVSEITLKDLQRRVPEPQVNDEIGRLARTMNGMLARLEASSNQQRAFVADASHELRSPLASIRTQLEVDVTHPAEADWQATMRGTLEEVERMQRLVDDLLLLARADEGATAAAFLAVDLDDIVLREVRRVFSANSVRVEASGVSAGQVTGDQDQLTRAVRNVLENARRYARSLVTVTLREEGGAVVLAIADDGPGISPGEREHIFRRFGRADASRTREDGGTGLGLAITQAIAVSHRGSIELDGDYEGGARFVMRLPAAQGKR